MKCEKCGINEATVYYKETINGVTTERRLCGRCASEENLGGDMQRAFYSLDNMWSRPLRGGFFGGLLGDRPGERTLGGELVCTRCGMTERQLRKTGQAGCPDCYRVFSDILRPYITRIQGASRHIGTEGPAGDTGASADSAVDRLRAQLEDAVKKEEYEQAAKLRDEIKRLEGEA